MTDRMIRDIVVGVWFAISTMCVVLTVMGVVHDMSDGKADGMRYVNGCETSESK